MSIVSLVGLVAATLVFFSTLALATESRTVAWVDLLDQSAQTYEDPYLDLNYDQLANLREIIVETAKIEEGGLGGEAKALSEAQIYDAKELLAEDGIDADWLIAQRWIVAERRERAATATNPHLDGQTVTLGGYAIPAPADVDGTTIVYLVPERGMCSHMPPPNANQMIRARVDSDWKPNTMHEPVRMTGNLSVKNTEHVLHLVDGEVPMRASFILDVFSVETIKDLRADPPSTNEWATFMTERLRASGQLPSQTEGTED